MHYRQRVAWVLLGLVLFALAASLVWAPALRVPRASLSTPSSGAEAGYPALQPSPSSVPTCTLTPPSLSAADPLVWVGGEESLSVLGPGGWRTFELPGIVRDIAIDPRGNAILAPGLRVCDGRLLRDLLPPAPGAEQDAVAVDAQGRIWVGYYGGIAVLLDGHWESIPLPPPAQVVRDLAIDDRGAVWVATDAGLARYDDSSWAVFDEWTEAGAPSPQCLAIDSLGRIWVGHDQGLSVLAGSSWQDFSPGPASHIRSLAVDHAGRILAGSPFQGISVFDGTTWASFAGQTSGLAGDHVAALACDAMGRLWAGTRLGLCVCEDGRWRTYQEANSDLGDNQVVALALSPKPLRSLPATQPPRYGRLTGIVLRGPEPAAGVRVVLCPELSLAQDFTGNPCEGASFSRTAFTAADGTYTFDWVPAGHYAVAAEVEPGRWVTRSRILSAIRYRVREGETTKAEAIVGEG